MGPTLFGRLLVFLIIDYDSVVTLVVFHHSLMLLFASVVYAFCEERIDAGHQNHRAGDDTYIELLISSHDVLLS